MKYVPEGGSLLHVISPAYLLRDYFVDNFDKLILKNNEYDALIPINLGMQQSRMKEMLVELCSNGLTEKELMERAKSAGWKYETVIDLLRACLNVVLTKGKSIMSLNVFILKRKRDSLQVKTVSAMKPE